jgi:hypothetical protein
MKFNSRKNSGFTLLQIFIALVVIALVAAFALQSIAQPYYTNSTPTYGGAQYNDSLVSPAQPGIVRANQYALGIKTGTSVTASDGTVTNTFATNYVYTLPPVVVVTQLGTNSSATNIVVSVTTTNFVYSAGKTSVTNNWMAIGR